MGRGSNLTEDDSNTKKPTKSVTYYSWKEIKESKKWIVIDDRVYNIENFAKKHPGGGDIITNHISQDVTDAFYAFHNDMSKVSKYLKVLEIGKLLPNDSNPDIKEENKDELCRDFRELVSLAHRMGLYESRLSFFILHFLQIVLLDICAMFLIYYSGYSNWFTYLFAALLLTTSQAQAGWLQHDLGHLSVFKSNSINRFVHRIVICTIKGVSADWWNYRHFHHHAKPNTLVKDPDISGQILGKWQVFAFGDVKPVELGKKKENFGLFNLLPYNYQDKYFLMIVPPLLLPIYFNLENIVFLAKGKNYKELFWALTFFMRWCLQYGPVLGIGGALCLYIFVRFLESHWFVWTTQMSHLPLPIEYDNQLSWFRSQLRTTCNVEQSTFNDWFSGHLNFQIEHHLFPTMPRHNYYKIQPYVKSLCQKHGIDYKEKTLFRAMADVYGCLKTSADLWLEAYNS